MHINGMKETCACRLNEVTERMADTASLTISPLRSSSFPEAFICCENCKGKNKPH